MSDRQACHKSSLSFSAFVRYSRTALAFPGASAIMYTMWANAYTGEGLAHLKDGVLQSAPQGVQLELLPLTEHRELRLAAQQLQQPQSRLRGHELAPMLPEVLRLRSGLSHAGASSLK